MKIKIISFTVLILIGILYSGSIAQTVESLYVNGSASTRPILNELNSHGIPDGSVASIDSNLANYETWTFDFDNTAFSGFAVNSAEIYLTHYQSGWVNDSLVIEYFDGVNFVAIDSFINVPTTLTTVGPYNASTITNSSQLDGFQVRLRGEGHIEPPEHIFYYVDAIELRVTLEVNDPPVISAIPPQTIAEGGHLDVRITATDPDPADILTLTAELLPPNAAFADSSGGIGGLVFDPDYTQSGVYQVRIIAADTSLADTQYVDITVNNVNLAPVLDPITTPQSVDEGANLSFRITSSDPDGNIPILAAVGVPTNGVFTDSLNGAGSFVFNPDFTQSGPYQVLFTASDGAIIDSQYVDINVTNVNLAPVLDPITTPQSVDEGANLSFRITAFDPDGNIPILAAVGVPTNAVFTDSLNGAGSFVFNPDFTQSGPYQVLFTASDGAIIDSQYVDITVNNVNLAPVLDPITTPQLVDEGANLSFRITSSDPDGNIPILAAVGVPVNAVFTDSLNGAGSFVFNPDFTQSGPYQVLFTASDGTIIDSQYVDIGVNNVDLPPSITPVSPQFVDEGAHLDVRISATDPDAGDIITLTAELLPTNAAFVDSSSGIGGLTFDPDFTQAGPYQVRIIASSNALADTQLVDITVTNFDLPPVLASVSPQTVAEGAHLDVRISASDPDIGDVITLSAELLPANAAFVDSSGGIGGLTFDPDFTQSGPYQVRIIANSNALADTQLVDITVTNTNLVPVLDPITTPQTVDEGANLSFRITASDPDGNIPTLTAYNIPVNAAFVDSLNGAGGFVFNPDYTQSGNYQVLFVADDGFLADSQYVDITVNHVDLPPVLDPIAAQFVDENASMLVRVFASDFDSDPITLTAEQLPTNATFVDSTGGVGGLEFYPDYFQSGFYQVRIIATSTTFADTQLVDITVNNVDRAPILNPIGNRSVIEGGVLGFLVTSSDPDLEPLTLTAENLPGNSSFADSGNGTGYFNFSPSYTQSGTYNIRFIVTDGVLSDSEIVQITVFEAGNQAPIISPIPPQSVREGAHLQFTVSASDPDGTTPALQGLNLPTNSSFVDAGNGTGTFSFNPNFNQANVYNVLFRAFDGSLYDSLWVEVTVTDSNRAVVLSPIGAQTVVEGSTLQFRVTASDPDGLTPVLSTGALPPNAVFIDSLNGSGSFTFTPDFTQAGIDTVLFMATDGVYVDSEFVQITVQEFGNNPPVLAPIGSRSVDEGALLQFVVSASDIDGQIPTLFTGGLPANAVFVDSLNGHGLFEIAPTYSQSGIYFVLFIASDGTAADSENVMIRVNNVNRAPVLDPITTPQTIAENSTLSFRVTGSDPDGTIPVLAAAGVPLNAVFVDSLNGAGSFVFTPDYTQSGSYQILFTSSDGALIDSQYVDINVTNVNLAPVLDPITTPQTIAEGSVLDIRITSSDPDGNIPTLTAVGVPLNAVFVDSLNGAGGFEFIPDYTQAGPYQVLFIASDGTLADSQYVDINVTDVNRAPVLDPIPTPQNVAENDTLLIRVTGSDPDGNIPTLTAVGIPLNAAFVDSLSGAGGFVFSPDSTQSGAYQVLFITSDGTLADSQFVDINVTNVNLAPVLDPITTPQTVAENGILEIHVTGSDPDGTTPFLQAVNLPANSVFVDSTNGAGGFVFTPDYTQSGPYQVLFIASDGTLADSQYVDINVTNVNLAPVLDPITTPQTIAEGATLEIHVTGSDPDGNIPTLTAVGVPLNAVFIDSLNGAGGFVFTPDFTQAGPYQVLFIAGDGALADSQFVDINVTDVNQSPVLDPITTPQTVAENGLLEIHVTGSDPDGTTPTLTAFGLPLNAVFVDSLNGAGGFVFTPDYSQSGAYQVLFVAGDGALADSQFVDINVTNVDLAPVLDPITTPQTIAEGATLEIHVTGSDPDGNIPTLSAFYLPLNATFADSTNGAGGFVFTPDYSQAGPYQVLFVADDGILADSQFVDITVTNVDLAPVIDPISAQVVDEGGHLEVRVSSTDFDGDVITLLAEQLPLNSTFVDSTGGIGGFVFDPDFAQAGVYQVRFIANSTTLADTQLVDITVNGVDLPPVIDPIAAQIMDEGTHLDVRVSSSDPDIGDIITLTAEQLPANAAFVDSSGGIGGLTFDPDFTQAGPYQVRIIATSNALADTQLVDITVNNVDLPPALDPILPQTIMEGQHLDVRAFASDPDAGDIINLTAELLPLNAAFVDSTGGIGGLTFDPDFTQAGPYQVRIIATSNALADTQLVDITVTDYDRPPVLDPIAPQVMDEGTHLDVRAFATDPDAGDIITLTVDYLPPNAAFVDSTGGVGGLTFDPDYTQAGPYQIRVIAMSNTLADTQLVDITVNNVDLPPAFDPISPQTVNEGAHLDLRVFAADPDGDLITLTAEQLPLNSAFVDSTGGVGGFTFDPDYVQAGLYQVRFIATAGTLADTALVDVTVFDAGNQPPVLTPIGPLTVDETQTLVQLVSATDADGQIPTLTAVNLPANSVFADSGNGTGSFTFTPDYFQSNIYDVTFIASDGALADTEIVAVTVVDVPRAPVWQTINDRALFEGQTINFRVSATDPDLTFPALSVTPLPTNAVFVDSSNGAGSFRFSPDYTQAGQYVLNFIASDGTLADTAVVNVFVFEAGNQAPMIDSVGPQSVIEGQHLEFPIVAHDPDSTIPALQALNLPANSAFSDFGDGTGLFSFDPDFTQAGVHNVLFRAFDGTLYDSMWVEITVIDFGFPPVLSPIGPQSITEGQLLSVHITSSDPDGTFPQLLTGALPPNAVFVDSLNGNGLFTFLPDYTQAGLDTVLFIASDGALADSEYVQISVIEAGNQTPVLDSIRARSVDEGQLLQFTTTASDPDGTFPSFFAVGLPVGATYIDNLNGTALFSFTPTFSQSGVYFTTFIASDGVAADSEVVRIRVNNVNRAPVLDTIITPQSVAEGSTLSIHVTSSDPDGTVPILQAVNLPLNSAFVDSLNSSGSFIFNPDYTQSGAYQVLFIATDGFIADSQYVDINVTGTDLPPVLDPVLPQTIAEGGHLDIRLSAIDPDGDIITLTAEQLPLNAAFVDSTGGIGGLTFDPDFTQAGPYQVRIIASSNALADTQLVDITVTNVDLPPAITAIPPQTMDEGAHLDVRVEAADPDGDPIVLTAEQLPLNAAFADSTGGIGGLTFDPDFTQSGVYQVRIIATSNALADTQLVDITVNNVDLAPVLDPILPQTVAEGGHLDVRVSAADFDGDPILLSAEQLPLNSAFVDSTGGVGGLTFDPDFTQQGFYQVRFIAAANGLADTQLVDISVTGSDLPPVIDPILAQVVDEGAHLDVRVFATDPDVGDIITLTAELLPLNAAFVDSTGGVGGLTFDPDYTQSGPYQVRIIANSNTLADTQLVDITVNNVDLPPVIAPVAAQFVDEGAHLDVRIAATDPDGDLISLVADQLPLNASFTDSTGGIGGIMFDPDYTQSGIYQVRVIANSNLLADTQFVDITVNNVDLPPAIIPLPPQTVMEGQHLDVRIESSDPDGDPITLAAEQLPLNAAFVDSTGGIGGLTFDPDFTQAGLYQVRIIATSNLLADTLLLDITVNEFDLPPVLDPIAAQIMDEGAHLDVRVFATDPDIGDIITLTAEQLPLNAAFVDSTGGIGGLTFDPDFTQSGVYQVRIIANSNTLADTQLVDITVNNVDLPPAFDPIAPQTITEGTHLDLRVFAADPDGDAVTLTADQLPLNSAFVDSTGGVGGLTFDPDFTQAGNYQVRFIATAGSLADTAFADITVLDAGNQAPVLNPIGPLTVNENDTLIQLITAIDGDGQIPTLTVVNLPPNATFADSANGTGTFVFMPDFFQEGVYNVTFIASDGVLADSEIVVVTVLDTPRPPVWQVINDRALFEGQTINFRVSASDPDLTIPTLSVVPLPTNAVFIDSLNGRGSFRFSPDYTQAGQYDLNFIAFDGALADTEAVTIFVFEAGNQAPVIDSVGPQTVIEGQHLEFPIISHDPDSTSPALQALNMPAHAAFSDYGDGTGFFTFDPDFTQAGVHNVLFRAFDGVLYDSMWVEITVIDYGFPPVLDPIGPQTVTEGQQLDIHVTSTDPDGTFPQLTAAPLPVNAVFVDSLNGNGLLTFAPDYTQSGIDSILFIASDGALADSEYVEITVVEAGNQAPILDPLAPQTVDEGSLLQLTVTASDPDSTIPALSTGTLPPNATFVDNLDGTGSFEFAPDFTQQGIDSVLFIAGDGLLADSQFVEITVNNTNVAPVLDPIPPQTTFENYLLQVPVHAIDIDGTIPILAADSLPVNATFVDSLNGSGLLQFRPGFDQAGVYQVLFTASDGLLADSLLVQITVNNVNRQPRITGILDQLVIEGDSLFFLVQASDPDGEPLVLSAPVLLVNSVFSDSGNGTGLFEYRPDFTQAGVDSVTFVASDGNLADTLKVQITTIDAGNQRPILQPIGPQTVDEGQLLTFNTYGSDPDGVIPSLRATGMPLGATFVDSSNGVGTFRFTPSYFHAGTYNVTFIATDGLLADSELVVITVNNVNRAPVLSAIGNRILNEGDSLGIRITATDADNEALTFNADSLVANMTFADSGNGAAFFMFLPGFTQSGVYNLTFSVTDGIDADTEFVQIDVLEMGNQPPTLAPIDTAYFITEGSYLGLPISAIDLENQPITLTVDSLVTNMTFTDNGDGTGLFEFTPSFVQAGIYPLRIMAFDGIDYDSTTTNIYVAEQGNQPPILDPIGSLTVAEAGSLVVNVSAVDPEGYIPVLLASSLPDSAYFTDNHDGTGQMVYYPDYFSAGIDTVRFTAIDNGGLSDYEDVQITITDVNVAPVIAVVGDTLVHEGDTLYTTIVVYDSTDADPGPISLSNGYLPPNSDFTITDNGVGLFRFYPGYDQSGIDSAYFYATDSDNPPLSTARWVRFTVLAANRPPVLQRPGNGQVDQGDTLTINVTATDPDGDSLVLFINCQCPNPLPPRSEFHDNGDGTGQFLFYPDYTQTGLYIIYFAVTDGQYTDTEPTLVFVRDMGNQRPTLNPIGPLSLTEGDTLEMLITSTDPDSTHPAVTVEGAPYNLVLSDSGNGTASIYYSPFFNQSGVYNMLFIANDGMGLADSEYVDLTVVEAGNQYPVLDSIADGTVNEGAILQFQVHTADPDSTIPVLEAHNLPLNATFADSANGIGVFTFTPNYFQSGPFSVTFVSIDFENPALADSQTINITVSDVNRPPDFVPIVGPFNVNEGQNLLFSVISFDADSTTPSLTVSNAPENSAFIDNGDGTGTFNFLPSYFQAGIDTVFFTATDETDPGITNTMPVYIIVHDVNRAPILDPIPDTTVGDGFMLSLAITSSDPDLTTPTFFRRNLPDSAVFTDHGDGTATLSWRPRFVDIGVYLVTIGCFDELDSNLADSQLVTITVVTSGNHPPIFNPIPDQQIQADHILDVSIVANDVENDPITITVGGMPPGMVFADSGNGHASLHWVPTMDQGGWWHVPLTAADNGGLTDTTTVDIYVVTFIRGDADGSGNVNVNDVVYLFAFLKGIGPAPFPMESGDANGSGEVNVSDVVYLYAYLKGVGPPPPPPVPPRDGGGIKVDLITRSSVTPE